jgi:CRP-like cAMP-binding protein
LACARNASFEADHYVFVEGSPADALYLIFSGRIALETHGVRGRIPIETLETGDVLGWSWLFAPHRWSFSARALEPAEAVAIDAMCLRQAMEMDPRFGYELMQRIARVIIERLQATRMQLVDMYSA